MLSSLSEYLDIPKSSYNETSRYQEVRIVCKFMEWMLGDPVDGVIKYASEEDKQCINDVVELFIEWRLSGRKPSKEKFESAANVAYAASAASAAANAVAYAATAANAAAYAAYADYAANAAANAAAYAAYAANAANAATAATAAYAVASAAKKAQLRNKLLLLTIKELSRKDVSKALDLYVLAELGSLHEGMALLWR